MKAIIYVLAVAVTLAGCSTAPGAGNSPQIRTIDSLRAELARSDAEIDALRERLSSYETAVDGTGSDSLSSERITASSSVTYVESDILLLNAAYYIVGRKADLMRRGVLKRTFPLFGRWYIDATSRLDDSFRRIDTSQPVTFAVDHFGARLISPHPEESYTVTGSKGGKFWRELHVTDPELFWSKTKVMVLAYD